VEVASPAPPITTAEPSPEAASAAVPEPAAPARLALAPDKPVVAAAAEALIFGRKALERYREASARGESEPIHQLRVTARRLRASLRLFADVIHGTYANAVNRDLTWMAQAAGAAREREITAAIVRERAPKLDPALARSLDPVFAALERERVEKLEELRKVLASKRYHRLLDRLEHPRFRKVIADTPLGERAGSMLRRIGRGVAKAGSKLDESSTPATIHRLRVRVKRLRYTVDMLSELGGKRCKRLLARLEEIQDLLGNLNDLSVAIGWMIEFPKNPGITPEAAMAAGAMAQLLRERSAKLARRGAKAWRKLDKSGAISDALDEVRRHGKESIARREEQPTTETDP
jgi:CHAD domain-containing protein